MSVEKINTELPENIQRALLTRDDVCVQVCGMPFLTFNKRKVNSDEVLVVPRTILTPHVVLHTVFDALAHISQIQSNHFPNY
jgi:hypothetical protein